MAYVNAPHQNIAYIRTFCYNMWCMDMLRQAEPNDARNLFLWRNDPGTRRMSLQTGEITYEGHLRWFHSKLNDSDCYFYILEHDRIPSGTIRLDRTEGGTFGLSYTIAPDKRGLGLGNTILSLAVAAASHTDGIEKLTAEVKEDNLPSIRCFEKNSFIRIKEENGLYLYERSL